MFRELVRKNKKLSMEDCVSLLKAEKRGVLSVNGDNGYPYVAWHAKQKILTSKIKKLKTVENHLIAQNPIFKLFSENQQFNYKMFVKIFLWNLRFNLFHLCLIIIIYYSNIIKIRTPHTRALLKMWGVLCL